MLKSWKQCPNQVIEIISQHLERPKGDGYPNGIEGSSFGPLTSIFIIAHEMVQFYLLNRNKLAIVQGLQDAKDIYDVEPTARAYQTALALLGEMPNR